jgi:predicted transglutaminase-like cysteine proteinase
MLRRSLAAFVTLGLWAHPPTLARTSEPSARVAQALRDYGALSQAAAQLSIDERETFVNNHINRLIGYQPDGVRDRWQTPAETFALAQGDCEDLAIAKYFVLRDCGRPCGCERLLYALHTPLDTPGLHVPHVVLLGGGHPGDPLVYDNLNLLRLPLSQRSDLQPLFSFDVAHLWRGASGERLGNAVVRLRPWRELLRRRQAQR